MKKKASNTSPNKRLGFAVRTYLKYPELQTPPRALKSRKSSALPVKPVYEPSLKFSVDLSSTRAADLASSKLKDF